MKNNHFEKDVRYTRYVSTPDYAEMHGKERKQITNYCKEERIPGVIRTGKNYLIPIDAPYPNDKRFSENKEWVEQ